MKKFLPYMMLAIVLVLASTTGMGQQLKEGSKVPEFSLPDQSGQVFDLKSVLGKKKLVIYFYPKDDSPGCTREACAFRDQYEVFTKADAMVIGISSQSVDSHKKFAEKYQLPFTLLSDTAQKVRKLFQIHAGILPGRVTFVVDKTGTIVYVFDSQMQATKHVENALNIIRN
jgi:thioredoxin-dependent peroxiredoxin